MDPHLSDAEIAQAFRAGMTTDQIRQWGHEMDRRGVYIHPSAWLAQRRPVSGAMVERLAAKAMRRYVQQVKPLPLPYNPAIVAPPYSPYGYKSPLL